MSQPLPILLLEDNPADAEFITHELDKAGLKFHEKRAATKDEFLTGLQNHEPGLILADYSLPGYNGFSALAAARERCPEVPFIFVSGSLGEDRVTAALHHGAADCVFKERLERLVPAVRRALREKELATKRKLAEKERQEAQELYNALSERSPDGIVILDPATARPLEFNTAAHRQLGYSREEFAQLSLADIEAAETPDDTRATIDRVMRLGKWEFNTQQRTREGQIRDIHVTAQVVQVSGHSVYHCQWRDITKTRQAEERLHLLSQALESSANAIVVADLEGAVIWANEAFTRLTGYPLPEVVGQKMSLLKSGAHDQPFYQQLWKTILAGQVWVKEMINRHKDGSLYHEENTITPVLGEGGKVTHFIAVKRDISERKRAQAALEQKEEYFRALTEMAADVTTVIDADGIIRYESPSAQQVFGFAPGELVGRSAFEFIHPADLEKARCALAESVAAPGAATRIELRFRHKDGSWRAVEGACRNLLNDPNIKGIVINTRDVTERQQLLKAVQETSQLNQQIIASAGEGIIVYAPDLRYQVWNPFMEALTGVPASRVLGQHPEELFPFLGKAGVLAALQKCLAGEPSPAIDFPFAGLPSGRSGWTSNANFPLRNRAGEIIGVIGTVQDITERKRAELRTAAFASLGQQLNGARTARQAGEVIVAVADELLGWDACLFDLYAAAEDRMSPLLGMDLIAGRRMECQRDDFTPKPTEKIRRAIEQGGLLLLRDDLMEMGPESIPFGDKARPSASIMYAPIRHGTEVLGIVSIQSYTKRAYDARSLETLQALADYAGGRLERLRAEDASQTAQKRLDRLLAQGPAMIYSLKFDGRRAELDWVSDNVERLLGFTVAECQGPQGLFDKVHPLDEPEIAGGLERVLAEKQISRDYRVRHKDGSYRWVHDDQRLLVDSEGVPVEIAGSWVDITERKGIEDQLRQSQKLEAVGHLAGGVAHDFNNVLAVIQGNTELMLLDTKDYPEETREGLQQVLEASQRAGNLTRQLLVFSRKEVMQVQSLALNEVIVNLNKMLRRVIGENIDLQCQCATPGPCVRADLGMMEQVVINLVVNARDAMPGGGRLRLTTDSVQIDARAARLNPNARAGEFVCLAVSDTGTGIAPEVLPRIFEPFFTTKESGKGTGLGLATVYGIVKQHQGWVEVASEVGRGTAFKIYLPAIPAPARVAAATKVRPPLRGGQETILLVEDEPAVRLTIRRLLNSQGYRVFEARSAAEALDLWSRYAREIALVVTDVLMPGTLTGRDLARQLQQESPGLRIIFLSGYNADEGGKAPRFDPAEGYFLQKPCASSTILKTVRKCLDETVMLRKPA